MYHQGKGLIWSDLRKIKGILRVKGAVLREEIAVWGGQMPKDEIGRQSLPSMVNEPHLTPFLRFTILNVISDFILTRNNECTEWPQLIWEHDKEAFSLARGCEAMLKVLGRVVLRNKEVAETIK